MNKTTIIEELRAGRPIVTYTKGVSMRPLLYEGKTQIYAVPEKRELKVGELPIFFLKQGTYIVHRVVKTEKDYYITRGDNCFGTETVPKNNILGIVTEIYKGNKKISVDNRWYKMYVKFWMVTAPVRIPLLKLRYKVRILKNNWSKKDDTAK